MTNIILKSLTKGSHSTPKINRNLNRSSRPSNEADSQLADHWNKGFRADNYGGAF